MGRAAPDIPDGMRGIHGYFARWRKSHTGRLADCARLRNELSARTHAHFSLEGKLQIATLYRCDHSRGCRAKI
jgi:hypothetical protein